MGKSSALRAADQNVGAIAEDERTATFLSDLSDLSDRHGIGIAGNAVLFLMEPEDRGYGYVVDKDSNLARA
jgi:hypothetical protein